MGLIICLVMQAVRTAINAQTSGDCGRIMIVLLTDGRANVSLGKSNEDPEAIAEGAPKPTQDQLKTEVSCSLHLCHKIESTGQTSSVCKRQKEGRLPQHDKHWICCDLFPST